MNSDKAYDWFTVQHRLHTLATTWATAAQRTRYAELADELAQLTEWVRIVAARERKGEQA